MGRRKQLQTSVPGFGCIFQPRYTYKGETRVSQVWWMEYHGADGLIRRSTGFRDQETAYSELVKLAGARHSGEILDGTPDRVRIGTLLDLLIESYAGKRSAYDLRCRVEKHLRPRWGDVKAVDMRKRDLEAWVGTLKRSGLASASINRCLANLRRAMKIGAKEDPPMVLRIPPFPFQDESGNEREGLVSQEQYTLLRDGLAPHARLAFIIGYHVGLRRGAILSLRWDWVDFDARVIRIPKAERGSGNKHRPDAIPIYGDILPFIEMAKAERDSQHPDCPWVVNVDGHRIYSLKTAWSGALRRLKLTGVRFHDLRRTAASNMHAAGIANSDIKIICGWKTDAMVDRYCVERDKRAQGVGDRMEQFFAAMPVERTGLKH